MAQPPRRKRRWPRVVGVVVGLFAVGVIALLVAAHHPPLATTPGPDAEALAHDMVRAVGGETWDRTGAVHWRLFNHDHLWDRARGLARVEWGKTRVLLDINKRSGHAFVDGKEVDGAERDQLVQRAYAYFVNDMFWLNPVVKAFDDGTTRGKGELDGKRALSVAYASGGVTPGDRYVWILDANARPERWRMWVHVLPVGGVEASFEGWQQLPTGAWVATRHRIFGIDAVTVKELRAAATLAELEPADPFTAM
jgi:hypothetical protein